MGEEREITVWEEVESNSIFLPVSFLEKGNEREREDMARTRTKLRTSGGMMYRYLRRVHNLRGDSAKLFWSNAINTVLCRKKCGDLKMKRSEERWRDRERKAERAASKLHTTCIRQVVRFLQKVHGPLEAQSGRKNDVTVKDRWNLFNEIVHTLNT